jgi:hypothetical protein
VKQVKRKKTEKNFKSEPQYTLGTLVKYLLLQASSSSGFFRLLQASSGFFRLLQASSVYLPRWHTWW